MLAIIGVLDYFAFQNESVEIKEKQITKEFNEAVEDDQNFAYLLKNAEYYYLKSDFETAKKELDIALKTYPQNLEANRLYIQTMIQLADKYPSYKEKAFELSKDRLDYLSDSKEDHQILKVYRSVFDL
jgi:tetratricopeptide (TPR) repeat protein